MAKSKAVLELEELYKNKVHTEGWVYIALSKGWPKSEIMTLLDVMYQSKDRHLVIRVESHTIRLMTERDFRFDGISKDGSVVTSGFTRYRKWNWHYYPSPVSITEAAPHIQTEWCATHGYECLKKNGRCGLADLIHLELCRCGRWHTDSCEVRHRVNIERAESAEADRLAKILKPIEHVVHTLPKEKRQKPSKNNGWLLPGQQDLTY